MDYASKRLIVLIIFDKDNQQESIDGTSTWNPCGECLATTMVKIFEDGLAQLD